MPRGKIETLSESSRRNLKLILHTITFDALAFTMALTLPGCTDGIPGAFAKRRFIMLCNRMTASRIAAIRLIGMMWKQELQKRGEVHFHLVLYRVTEENRRSVQRWIAKQWNELICSRSSAEDRANHLWWHLRDGSTSSGEYNPKADNMQEVRDFAGYFAKYLGKEEKAQAARDPIPGRWWGKVNKQNIPWAKMKELELPLRMRIHCQRIARKIRQKKADAAKHLCVMRELSLVRLSGPNKGDPIFSQFALTCGEGRKGTDFGNTLRKIFEMEGKCLGPVRFPAPVKFSAVKLTGKSASFHWQTDSGVCGQPVPGGSRELPFLMAIRLEKTSDGCMPSFDYITTPDFRISLEADHREMCDCFEAGAWKSVQVLAGSIVEALLVDYLVSTPNPAMSKKDPLKMDLSETISICKSEAAISDRSADLCSVIRSYRNLIHPARMVRLGEQPPSKTSASVATALIDMIADEIADTRRSTVGLTGEQILLKISNDTGCVTILKHLLTEVSEAQKENLLLNLIPNHYFANLDLEDPFSDDPDRFSESYRIIFAIADESIKKRAAQNFVTLLKEADGIHIKEYSKAFFRSQDLKYVKSANQDLVKAHLLGTVSSFHSLKSLKAIEKIGPYLTTEDCINWLDPFVRTLVSANVQDSIKKKCREVLSQTSRSTIGSFDEAWQKRLNVWQTHYEKGDSQSNADLMKELQDDLAIF